MPWHIAIDQASERRLGKLQIGTTRRGIGPAYADKASRIGIRVQDVLDPKILRQKIEVALAEKNVWLERVYEVERLRPRGGRARGTRATRSGCGRSSATRRCSSTRRCATGKDVLFEGAQATLLDLDHGTYPFVTSSNPIASGACDRHRHRPDADRPRARRREGVRDARRRGPVPVRDRGPRSGSACSELGGEFGTVTGRVRRCGWLDLVALRYAVRVNGITSLALTKLDVLSDFAELPVCVALPPARRLRDAALPGAPERLPPRRAGVGGAARAGRSRSTTRARATSCPRRRAATSSSSSASSRCRSSWSASAPRASACSPEPAPAPRESGRPSEGISRGTRSSGYTAPAALSVARTRTSVIGASRRSARRRVEERVGDRRGHRDGGERHVARNLPQERAPAAESTAGCSRRDTAPSRPMRARRVRKAALDSPA